MATMTAATLMPDRVLSFDIMPGTLGLLRESMAEGGPRIKCYERNVTLVSPGETHEATGQRLIILILAICSSTAEANFSLAYIFVNL